MSQAPTYTRTTSFADDERNNAGGRATVATADVDAELDAVGTSLNQTISNLGLLQRGDGVLRDGAVPVSSLGADTLKLLTVYASTPRGAWLTATSYAAKDLVTQGGNTYICAQAHTSGTFATDLAAVKWLLFQIGANPNAAAMPFSSTGLITSSNVQAAITEVDTNWRALASLSPMTATRKREVQTATAGQTVFTLTTMAYTVGDKSLLVSVDGQDLPQSDYTETSPTVVTFGTGLLVGQQVEFHSGYLSALGTGKFATADTGATSTVFGPSYEFRRDVNYIGGDPTKVNSSVRAVTFVNTASTTNEWTGLFEMHNSSPSGENVALYAQGTKNAGAGATWASVFEGIDRSGSDPTSGVLGAEIDIRGNGTDANANRIGLDIVATVLDGSAPTQSMTAAYGLRFQTNNNAYVTFGTLIGTAPNIHAGLGIDLSGAIIIGAAMKLSNTQAIQFDTSVLLSNADNGMDHSYSGVLQNRLLKTGGLQVHTVKVVGDRQTGWAAPTGTLSRATFDQSTVTLPLLAQRVAALITDLTTHGLIGA